MEAIVEGTNNMPVTTKEQTQTDASASKLTPAKVNSPHLTQFKYEYQEMTGIKQFLLSRIKPAG